MKQLHHGNSDMQMPKPSFHLNHCSYTVAGQQMSGTLRSATAQAWSQALHASSLRNCVPRMLGVALQSKQHKPTHHSVTKSKHQLQLLGLTRILS
jgi:hypothetical protein